jgi:hypothetical protein
MDHDITLGITPRDFFRIVNGGPDVVLGWCAECKEPILLHENGRRTLRHKRDCCIGKDKVTTGG